MIQRHPNAAVATTVRSGRFEHRQGGLRPRYDGTRTPSIPRLDRQLILAPESLQ